MTELLQILDGNIITSDVEHNVLKSTTMTIGKNETITVDELGVLGVISHELAEQDMSHRSTTHGSTYQYIPKLVGIVVDHISFDQTYQDDQSWHP